MLQAFLQRIRSADNLPSLPTVAVQVLQLAREADVPLERFTTVIQNDPAMTAKLLKVVNSPLFGMPRQVGSLKQAVTLLGLRKLTIMTLSFSLVDSIRSGDAEGRNLEGFWRRSISTAIAARLLARTVAREIVEEAFVAGLLSDIGMIVAWRCTPDLYQPVLDACSASGRLIQDVELQMWGCTHATIGRELLKVWGLPDILCDAVGAHHGETLADLPGRSRRLATVMHSAATIAELFCGGLSPDQLDHVLAQCAAETGVERAHLEKAMQELDEHVRQTAATLAVPIGRTLNYADLQAEAAMLMADLSIQAETARDEADRRAQQAHREAHRLHQERAALLEAVSTDALTQLANRTSFDRRLKEELRRAREHQHPLGLIFMDLDHFKNLNDRFGHQAGDQVLRSVGERLSQVLAGVGFAARYGGEEFVVLITGHAVSTIEMTAEAIRKSIEAQPIPHGGRELKVTASLGVACLETPWEGLTSEYFLAQADQQLYRAKRQGRNRVVIAERVALV